MATKREQNKATTAYRRAARKLYGYTREQAEACVYAPHADPGGWAPEALVVLNLESGLEALNVYSDAAFEEGLRLAEEAGVGHVESLNGGVSAVYD